MKNLFVILFTCFTLFSFSQDENLTDAQGKKQGLWKKYHDNGMIRYKGNFKDDQPIGEFIYFYDTGKLQVKMTHFGAVSYANVYYETGELKAAGKYENQLKDSVWSYYSTDGFKMADEFYINGKREGSWKVYYSNAQVTEEKEYTNDFENGIWKQYFIDGKEKLAATYVNGELEGRATYYDSNGKKVVSGTFIRGARDGFWTFYEQDGTTVRKKEEYKNGVRVDANKDDNIIDMEGIKYIPENEAFPEELVNPKY